MLGRKLTKEQIIESIHADPSCFIPVEKLKTDERYTKYINGPEVTVKIILPEENNLTLNNNDDCKDSHNLHQLKPADLRDQQ